MSFNVIEVAAGMPYACVQMDENQQPYIPSEGFSTYLKSAWVCVPSLAIQYITSLSNPEPQALTSKRVLQVSTKPSQELFFCLDLYIRHGIVKG